MTDSIKTKTIKILPGKRVTAYRIFLGDMEISTFIHGLDIKMGAAGTIPEVILHCHGFIEIPDELEALVYVEKERQWGEISQEGLDRISHKLGQGES